MLVFVETGKPESFVKAVGQSVKNKQPKIDYTPSKSAKSQASKAAKNSGSEVQKQLDLIRKKKTSAA